MNTLELEKIANKIRQEIVTSIHAANSGHPGGSLSATEIFTYLYFQEMHINPEQPGCNKRDRFVLSKGHVAPGLYATLAVRGYFPKDELVTLRKLGSHLQGHPCKKNTPGIDMSSGSLGQGFSAAVGMALSMKMDGLKNRVYCVCGDGELQEGQIWEAAMFAGHRKLNNLIVVIDNNNLQIDGPIDEICSPYPIDKKFEAFNFHTITIDGHSFKEIIEAFKEARRITDKPIAIISKTIKGKGISYMENNANWHGKAPNDKEYQIAMSELKKVEKNLCQQ
jgi:transketolase